MFGGGGGQKNSWIAHLSNVKTSRKVQANWWFSFWEGWCKSKWGPALQDRDFRNVCCLFPESCCGGGGGDGQPLASHNSRRPWKMISCTSPAYDTRTCVIQLVCHLMWFHTTLAFVKITAVLPWGFLIESGEGHFPSKLGKYGGNSLRKMCSKRDAKGGNKRR